MSVAINVPAGTPEPASERYELARVHKDNGRTPVVNTKPWTVYAVEQDYVSGEERVAYAVAETKTRRGAATKARRLAASPPEGTGLQLGRVVAFVVVDDVDSWVWDRAEVS